jgi:hypothetical protein
MLTTQAKTAIQKGKTMRAGKSQWACGMLLALLFAPPAAADLFTYTGTNVQTFTALVDGIYEITADGASGGNTSIGGGGFGAEIGGKFTLTAGEILTVYVGGQGADSATAGAGGGGGSFVIAPGDNPLVIASGGGGASVNDSGGGGYFGVSSSDVGSAGEGSGGGSFTSAGADGDGDGGSGFPSLSGGVGGLGGSSGGFGGGGGGGENGGGGGGGYKGGNGGDATDVATGGGSFDAGIDQILKSKEHEGNGDVEIDLVQATVPEPASCVLFGTILVGVCAGLRRLKPNSSSKSTDSKSLQLQERKGE